MAATDTSPQSHGAAPPSVRAPKSSLVVCCAENPRALRIKRRRAQNERPKKKGASKRPLPPFEPPSAPLSCCRLPAVEGMDGRSSKFRYDLVGGAGERLPHLDPQNRPFASRPRASEANGLRFRAAVRQQVPVYRKHRVQVRSTRIFIACAWSSSFSSRTSSCPETRCACPCTTA